jgi:hypothetical protein
LGEESLVFFKFPKLSSLEVNVLVYEQKTLHTVLTRDHTTMNYVNVSQTCYPKTTRSPGTAELNVWNLLFLFLYTDFFNGVLCNVFCTVNFK